MPAQERKWKTAFIMTIIIGALDIGVLSLGAVTKIPISWSVGSVGVITFLGMLMFANYLSGSPKIDKGEIRKAIATSCFVVYFVLLALVSFTGFSPSDTEVAKIMIGNFGYVVGIVAVFYFGSRSVEEYIKAKGKALDSGTEEPEEPEEQGHRVG